MCKQNIYNSNNEPIPRDIKLKELSDVDILCCSPNMVKLFTIPIFLYIKLQFKTPLQELLIDTISFLPTHTFSYDIG